MIKREPIMGAASVSSFSRNHMHRDATRTAPACRAIPASVNRCVLARSSSSTTTRRRLTSGPMLSPHAASTA
uniref:hypothetical protein n=1 Tax=Acetobacter cibinongensis TaxID=146475 RepID=UPI0038CF90DD